MSETVIGFDYGRRKIGVAIGQTVSATASPLTTLRYRGEPDWQQIGQLLADWRPAAAIVGLPFNMDDTEATTAPGARVFAKQLAQRFGIAVHLVDERLTSIEARHRLGKKATSLEVIDAMAATLILETWLGERH